LKTTKLRYFIGMSSRVRHSFKVLRVFLFQEDVYHSQRTTRPLEEINCQVRL